MSEREDQLKKMLKLMSQLNAVAIQLKEASAKSISESELEELQRQEDVLIHKLIEIDALVKKTDKKSSSKADELQKNIDSQLQEFEKTNAAFFEHLRTRLSLIQFTLPKED